MVHGYKNQCLGKKAYPTHASAGTHLSHLRKRIEDAANQEPYFCGWCSQWHLGHKSDNADLQAQRKAERLAAITDDSWRTFR